ncbi:MAG TPA: tRNA lysidine(34) synthetase TilS [Acidimicrobiia bacterium]|nr:tRNA lysidine(34) synthetase TilS [Acidimicrobiia bacterium]
MAETRRLSELIAATLPRLELPDGPVVVALSGGADSAALALLCVEEGSEVSAIHVDHQLPASPTLAAAASAIAARLGISLAIHQVVVDVGPSPEDMARRARYEVFARSSQPVLTAHTQDDNVETIMINLIRGTGSAGLAGIPRFRPPQIHRPILDLTRNETRELSSLAGLPFRDDPMNDDLTLTRNKIRLEILPMMRELNPEVDAALARAAATLRRDIEYLDDQAATLSQEVLPISVLTTAPRVLADRLLRRALEESGVGVTSDRIDRMWSVVCGESERQELAGGRAAVRREAMLVIE